MVEFPLSDVLHMQKGLLSSFFTVFDNAFTPRLYAQAFKRISSGLLMKAWNWSSQMDGEQASGKAEVKITAFCFWTEAALLSIRMFNEGQPGTPCGQQTSLPNLDYPFWSRPIPVFGGPCASVSSTSNSAPYDSSRRLRSLWNLPLGLSPC